MQTAPPLLLQWRGEKILLLIFCSHFLSATSPIHTTMIYVGHPSSVCVHHLLVARQSWQQLSVVKEVCSTLFYPLVPPTWVLTFDTVPFLVPTTASNLGFVTDWTVSLCLNKPNPNSDPACSLLLISVHFDLRHMFTSVSSLRCSRIKRSLDPYITVSFIRSIT